MVVMVSCSSLLALIVTGFELSSSYRQGVSHIEAMHEEITLVHGDLLVHQIWALDERSARASIDGLVRLRVVDRVELNWEGHQQLSAGLAIEDADIKTVLPLYKLHDGENYSLGELHLFSNLDQLRFEIMSLLGARLFFNFLKTLVVCAVVLYFFHRIATVHLHKISTHADSLALGASYKPLALNRSEKTSHDELQTLVDAINGMGCRLQQEYLRSEDNQSDLERLVSERTRHLENANQRLVEKSRLATIGSLVAMVAHELRNPLGTIKASVSLLSARCSDEVERSVIYRIDRNIDRCDSTVEQLRRMSNKSVQYWEVVDLQAWLTNYVESKLRCREGFDLHCDFTAGLLVFVDEFQLDMIVRNLLENAKHAIVGRAEGPKGLISLHLYSEQGLAVLKVTDNGVGLSSAVLEKAFDPLFSTKQYGFGMGLTLSRNLIEFLGGDITLSSREGIQGTIATLRLPLHQVDQQSTPTDG